MDGVVCSVMLQRSGWSELLRAKASVFALNEETKQWVDRGSSGQLWLSQNEQHPLDVRMKWWAPSRGESWWRLMSGQLKAKGERAWVLKALDLGTKSEEIVAIRFSDIPSAHNFALRFHLIFGPHSQSQSESAGRALAADSGNVNVNALGHHQSARGLSPDILPAILRSLSHSLSLSVPTQRRRGSVQSVRSLMTATSLSAQSADFPPRRLCRLSGAGQHRHGR